MRFRSRKTRRSPVTGIVASLVLVGLIAGVLALSGIGNNLVDRVLGVSQPVAAAKDGSAAATTGPSLSSGATTMVPAGATASSAATAPAGSPVIMPATPTPPSPAGVATEYLKAWEEKRYSDMYAFVAASSRQTIDEKKFVGRYQSIYGAATVSSIAVTAGQPQLTALPNTAKMAFEATYKTVRLGEFKEVNSLTLIYEEGRWGVQWNPSLIFKDLTGDNLMRMTPLNPQRGSILDRQGRPLATQGYVIQVGVVPGEIKNESAVLAALQDYTKVPIDDIKKKYASAQPDWFIPIKDIPTTQEADARAKLETIDGIMLQHKAVRIYPNNDVASNIVGYVSKITAEDLTKLEEKGYTADDVVGREGIESWGEEQLAGQRGGKLAVVTPNGDLVKVVAEQPIKRGNDIQLAIDIDIQRKAEQTIGDAPGSIVVLDPRDNSVLAAATNPRYDPNKFVLGFSDQEWNQLLNNPMHPLVNRPFMSGYAPGSIFKVMTFSLAIEKLGYNADTPVNCAGSWTVPGTNIIMRDWIPAGHGILPFAQALTESCNVPMYEVGYKMNGIDPGALPAWAQQWGLGKRTGVVGVPESDGIVPDPAWKQKVVGQEWYPGDSVNLAIGQGFLQVTPIQMANIYSSLAAHGQKRSPVVVSKITTVDGQLVKAYAAEDQGKLPIQETTLQALYRGLSKVASTPTGTAYYAFSTFKVPMMAKTGSAENQGPQAHAWFAGYAPQDNPQYLVIVMGEGGQSGASFAAPRARTMFDYFFPPDGQKPAPGATASPANQAPAPDAQPAPAATTAPKPAATTAPAKPVATTPPKPAATAPAAAKPAATATPAR